MKQSGATTFHTSLRYAPKESHRFFLFFITIFMLFYFLFFSLCLSFFMLVFSFIFILKFIFSIFLEIENIFWNQEYFLNSRSFFFEIVNIFQIPEPF